MLCHAVKTMTGKDFDHFFPKVRLVPGQPLVLDPPSFHGRPMFRAVANTEIYGMCVVRFDLMLCLVVL